MLPNAHQQGKARHPEQKYEADAVGQRRERHDVPESQQAVYGVDPANVCDVTWRGTGGLRLVHEPAEPSRRGSSHESNHRQRPPPRSQG